MNKRAAISACFVIAALPVFGAMHGVVLRNGVWSEASDCQPAEAAWIWSDDAAPRSADAAQWSAVCESKTLNSSKQRLSLKVVPLDRRATLAVVAAPLEMWRQVPEALLPRFAVDERHSLTVPHDGHSAWRVRAIGQAEGTDWIDVPIAQRNAVLGSTAAVTRVLQLLASDGAPAAGATVEIIRQNGNVRPDVRARYVADRRGAVAIPALPDLPPLHFVTHHAAHAVDAFSATVAEFPLTRRLEPGARIHGRIMNGDEPLAGVAVEVETWVAGDLPQLLKANTTTTAKGTFAIEHFPRRAAALVATKSGFVPHHDALELSAADTDLGTITLEQGGAIALLVVDDANHPVANAKIDAGGGRTVTSGTDGKARLSDVPVKQPVVVTATAAGHLRERIELVPPFAEARIRLQRGVIVKGRLADSAGLPIPAASVRVETGPSYRVDEGREDGTFEVTLAPGTDATLALSSPSTTELVIPVAAGVAGEVRDLGTITVPKGLLVTGRVARSDGSPVAGARVWLPKQSRQGPLVAFMNNELVEATSAADGTFALSGLEALPLVLRIDAPGFARSFRQLQLDGSVPVISVGDITLAPGATLRVRTNARDAMARVDLRGEALDIDILAAAVRDDVATVPHVPLGNATITIVRDRRTVCEKRIAVDRSELTVDCDPIDTLIRGAVVVGSAPARGGSITWTPASKSRVAAAIMERTSPNGLRQQQVWGTADAPVRTELDETGRFESNDLRPGRWEVAYGGSSQRIDIPDQDEVQLSLRFDDNAIAGIVVDADGDPVARSVVEIASANAAILTGDDGSFDLHGVIAGEHDVRARSIDGRTATEHIRIEEGRPAPPLRLVLRQARPTEVHIAVTRGGVPAAGAFVFAELENEGQRILTADSTGVATLRIAEDSTAKRLRLASFANGTWSFSDWRNRDQRAISLSIGLNGALSIAGATGEVEIVRADGWNVSQLLRRLGAPPRVERSAPLLVSGLAPGTYTVAIGGKAMQAEVAAGRSRELNFE